MLDNAISFCWLLAVLPKQVSTNIMCFKAAMNVQLKRSVTQLIAIKKLITCKLCPKCTYGS